MELIKCSNYVIILERPIGFYESRIDWMDGDAADKQLIVKYANFLKQPLTLGMFIPCDLEGNVLEEPRGFGNKKLFTKAKYQTPDWMLLCQQYQEAKERVLFEGVEIINYGKWVKGKHKYGKHLVFNGENIGCEATEGWMFFDKFKTIEDLTEVGLTLTKSAIKLLK